MSSLKDKIAKMQQTYKAPKSDFNDHGKYKYRSIEKMLEALKPVAKENKVLVFFSDESKEIAGQVRVDSTVTVLDLESDESMSVTAGATEADTQKGMQRAQISGSTASYARKFALSALLNIDDTEEIDAGVEELDWGQEIDGAKDVKKLMAVWNKMNTDVRNHYKDQMSEKRLELVGGSDAAA